MGIRQATIKQTTNKQTTISKFLSCTALVFFMSSPAIAGTVEITYENPGTSTMLDIKTGPDVSAGLEQMTIDGNTNFAMSDTNSRPANSAWTATVNTYTDVQNGAGKFNRRANDKKKYNQAGYLFSLLDFSETLSETAAQHNALVNYVIWDIMDKDSVAKLKNRADRHIANDLREEAKNQKNFDWSSTMLVYTSTDRGASRELFSSVSPPIATPIPSAIFLFGSMALGFFGLATRRRMKD